MNENNKNKLFGSRLKKIRIAKGLTQEELGNRIGVSQRIMHHYENKAEYPPTQKVIELAIALDMSIDELLGFNINTEDKKFQNIKPNLAKKLRLASRLPSYQIKTLSTFIEALLAKQNNSVK